MSSATTTVSDQNSSARRSAVAASGIQPVAPVDRRLLAGRFGLFASIAAVGLIADLATKSWIFDRLGMPGGDAIPLIDGVLSLETQLNRGALFSLGQGYQPLFALLSVAAIVFILVWLFVKGAARELWLTVALAMVMAGVLGNLWDRVGIPGLVWDQFAPHRELVGQPVHAVRDWIHFEIAAIGFDWPVFNIADSLLVCGAIMLGWHAIRTEVRASTGEDSADGGEARVTSG
ncbi:MAG: signal peptidase II [Planctomycetales bacterium]|nr:signal peptidase II [Planctomycetales bacterium]